jgi:hypothetical protein
VANVSKCKDKKGVGNEIDENGKSYALGVKMSRWSVVVDFVTKEQHFEAHGIKGKL